MPLLENAKVEAENQARFLAKELAQTSEHLLRVSHELQASETHV